MADFVADFVADGSPELATSTTDTNDEADSSSISSSYETSDEFAPGREEVEGEAEEEEVFEIADYTSASGWERLVSAIERVLTGWLRAEPAEQRAVVKWQQQELEMLYLACDDLLHTPTATANGVEETYRIFPRVKPSEPASVLHLWTNEPRYIVLRPPSVSGSNDGSSGSSSGSSSQNRPHRRSSVSSPNELYREPVPVAGGIAYQPTTFHSNIDSDAAAAATSFHSANEAKMVLSALTVASRNAKCSVPFFVPVRTHNGMHRTLYRGLQWLANDVATTSIWPATPQLKFESTVVDRPPDSLQTAAGLRDLFRDIYSLSPADDDSQATVSELIEYSRKMPESKLSKFDVTATDPLHRLIIRCVHPRQPLSTAFKSNSTELTPGDNSVWTVECIFEDNEHAHLPMTTALERAIADLLQQDEVDDTAAVDIDIDAILDEKDTQPSLESIASFALQTLIQHVQIGTPASSLKRVNFALLLNGAWNAVNADREPIGRLPAPTTTASTTTTRDLVIAQSKSEFSAKVVQRVMFMVCSMFEPKDSGDGDGIVHDIQEAYAAAHQQVEQLDLETLMSDLDADATALERTLDALELLEMLSWRHASLTRLFAGHSDAVDNLLHGNEIMMQSSKVRGDLLDETSVPVRRQYHFAAIHTPKHGSISKARMFCQLERDCLLIAEMYS